MATGITPLRIAVLAFVTLFSVRRAVSVAPKAARDRGSTIRAAPTILEATKTGKSMKELLSAELRLQRELISVREQAVAADEAWGTEQARIEQELLSAVCPSRS